MKLIHTADIHLDTAYAWAARPGVIHGPGFGARRRLALRTVFQDIMRRATEWPADALLIAGDLFDAERLQWDTVSFLREMFALVRPIPVFIAPGESDPHTPDSPYACEPWPPNVHIFRAPAWSSVDLPDLNAVVHGAAFDGPQPSNNPLAEGLSIKADGCCHIAVAHGAEMSHLAPGTSGVMPFHAGNMAHEHLSYLALGHYHEITPIMGQAHTAMSYPGTPEGLDFNAPGMHYFLEIEVEAGGEATIRPVDSSRILFEAHEIDCTGFHGPRDLAKRLGELAGEGLPRALHLTLSGRAPENFHRWLREALGEAASGFELLSWSDQTDASAYLDALARQSTSLGAFAERLAKELADAPDETRRRALRRTREAGIAAYRGETLPLPQGDVRGGAPS